MFLVFIAVQTDLMREESLQSVNSPVERLFSAYSFPRVLVMEF